MTPRRGECRFAVGAPRAHRSADVRRMLAIGTYHPARLTVRASGGERRRCGSGGGGNKLRLRELRDEVTRLRTDMRASVEDVHVAFSERDTELARALRRVADACHVVAGRIEGERAERAALVDVVSRLGASVAASLAHLPSVAMPPRHRVIGGTIDPEIALDDDVNERAVVTPDVLRHESVEVHCRFGDRWVGGFEVAEVVPGDGGAVYRLRRRSDDSVLPTLFDERDIRFRVSLVDR